MVACVGERVIDAVAFAIASGMRITGMRRLATKSRNESLVKRFWRSVTGVPTRTESGAAL